MGTYHGDYWSSLSRLTAVSSWPHTNGEYVELDYWVDSIGWRTSPWKHWASVCCAVYHGHRGHSQSIIHVRALADGVDNVHGRHLDHAGEHLHGQSTTSLDYRIA